MTENDVVRIGGFRSWVRVLCVATAIALVWLFWYVATGAFLVLFVFVLLPVGLLIRSAIWPRWAEVSSRGITLGRADRTELAWPEVAAVHFEKQLWWWSLVVVPTDASRIRALNTQLPTSNATGYGYVVAVVGRSTREKHERALAGFAGAAYGEPVSSVSRAGESLTAPEQRRLVRPRQVARTIPFSTLFGLLTYAVLAPIFGVVALWISLRRPTPLVEFALIFGVVPLLIGGWCVWLSYLRWQRGSVEFTPKGVVVTSLRRAHEIPWEAIDRIGVGLIDVAAYLRADAEVPRGRAPWGLPRRRPDGSIRLMESARDTGVAELKDMVTVAALAAGRPDVAASIVDRGVIERRGKHVAIIRK